MKIEAAVLRETNGRLSVEEVEIGVPLSILSQLQTPGALLSYLNKVAHVPHVVSWRPPSPTTAGSAS